MQALSLAVHIPLVCFGISFPAIVLFMEGLYLRTGKPVYKALAKRWSKVMLILFAIGVVTGTILSFELGLLWPQFMQKFGEVFGFAFAIEGLAFFVEAIFITIYVYGWDRLSARAHFLSGLVVAAAGILGSTSVIAVNGWMNNPQGFTLHTDGTVTDVHPFSALFNPNLWHEEIHMYLAGFIVASALVAGVYAVAWLRGRRDRYHRAGADRAARGTRRWPRPRRSWSATGRRARLRTSSRRSWRRSRACNRRPRAPPERRRHLLRRQGPRRRSRSRACSRCWPSTTPTPRSRDWTPFPPTTGRRSGSCATAFRSWSASGPLLAALGSLVSVVPLATAGAAGDALVLPRSRRSRARRARRSDRRLDRHRGRPPAVDRLRAYAHRGGGHRRRGDPGWVCDAGRRLHRLSAQPRSSCCAASPGRGPRLS